MKGSGLLLLAYLLVGAALAAPARTAPQTSRFVLKPTRAAPLSAGGLVEFGGAASGTTTLSIKTQGLGPGIYWLELVRRSDAASLQLGPLGLPNMNYIPDRQAGQDFRQRSSTHQAYPLATTTQVFLPQGWDAADLGQLRVLNEAGVPMLEGYPDRP